MTLHFAATGIILGRVIQLFLGGLAVSLVTVAAVANLPATTVTVVGAMILPLVVLAALAELFVIHPCRTWGGGA